MLQQLARIARKTGLVLGLLAVAALSVPRAHAEGSAELDARDVMGSGAHDQSLDRDTNLYVDILNDTGDFMTGSEKICWTGSGTLSVYPIGSNPWTGTPTALHTLTSGTCTSTALGTVGQYPLRPSVDDQVVGTRWDIRVCDFDDACGLDSANERTGRVWSRQWIFELGVAVYTQARANNGSVFAIVPGGDVGLDAVIEMTLDGVSGADYKLYANSIGPQVAADDTRVGRSVPRTATYEVIPEFKLYLNPPETAQYNWREPEITSVELAPSCGTGVVLDTAPGTISFDSNVTGQYVVVCDVDGDDVFDFASNTDFSSFGDAIIGNNVVEWDGKNNNGVNAMAGTYDCIIRLNVGEFHYVGEDIETSFNGIRMFRVESNKTTRTPVNMFWDDGLITPADAENMPAPVSRPAASEPEPDGLDPVGYMVAANAFRRSMAGVPSGNARAWGNFDADGKGNDTYLDTFSAADTAESPTFQITIITAAGDADTDALSNQRECAIGSDPQDNDSDDDGVNDGFEATNSTLPNSDSGVDAVPDVLDPDDDGDGIPTLTELGGENGDGNPTDAANSDGAGDGPDYLDIDSDDDGVDDADDVDPTDPLICRDTDGDSCDDCALTGDDGSGGDPADDGTDTDGDGDCNDGSTGDDDDDNDGVPDTTDSAPLIATQCRDQDGDGCDDCAITGPNNSGGAVGNDGADFDMDGACNDGAPGNPNDGDPDDDNDGVPDGMDSAPTNASLCRDVDTDGCNDCALTGNNNSGGDVDGDGPDADMDGLCNDGAPGNPTDGDPDDDNDGVNDGSDILPLNPNACRDVDADACNDCVNTGADESGGDPDDDGLDTDGDGICNDGSLSNPIDGDPDDDNDGVIDADDTAPLDSNACRDTDTDGCNDCVNTGDDESGGDPDDDGLDTDGDGSCDSGAPGNPNDGDPDDDNDGVDDADDSAVLDPDVCSDTDLDSCDDCSVTGDDESGGDPDNDGVDTDSDGICDLGELDTDGDGVPDPVDLDADNDGIPNADERDEDTDGDGLDNAVDLDADGDGLTDILEGGGADLDDDEDGVIDELVDANTDGLHDPLQVSGDELPLPNSDEDSDPDFLDLDSDADGLLDIVEAGAIELDDNGNGRVDGDADTNGNGLADEVDPDGGLATPGTPFDPPDSDNDGDDDFRDPDDDNDGIDTQSELDDAEEYGEDIDSDDKPNYLDTDTDGDELLDTAENAGDGDANNNGVPDYVEPFIDEPPVTDDDADDDGLLDEEERDDGEDRDTDEDGLSDFEDPDDDGDGILTRDERPLGDTDDDGAPNYLDADDDDDGVLTRDERTNVGEDIDTDDDGTPDHLDADDDDDGIPTHDERAPASTDIDTDDDGDPNYLDPDDDNDGLLTRDERTEDGEDIDTDADAIPNHLDPDDDGDGIVTEEERTDDGDDIDTDDDGVPNHLDTDDDGDGIATDVEFSDGDDFGNDVDQDGIPNHLDPDSDGDGISDADEAEQDENNNNVPDYLEEVEGIGGFAGGALCSISSAPRPSHGSMTGFGLLALALSTLVLRSRASHKRSSRNLRGR